MAEIVDRNLPITREVWDRAKIKAYFQKHGENFKAEWADELPKDEAISVYKQGDWLDMCLGPHLPSTGKLGKAFKLTKVSGAYWRGDARNAQLQRVYGTVFFSDKELKDYLHRIEEAEKRDHRRIGREMGLFHQQEEAAGMVFWHPKGWTFWRTLERYLRRKLDAAGYLEVKTPQLVDRKLWEESGHWEKFRENMYLSENEEGLRDFIADPDKRIFALKPMNCPCHVRDFQPGTSQLPRAAAAHGRIRLMPSLRAVRRAARHPAGPQLHAGRRPHLLQRGADRKRDDPLLQAAGRGLPRSRLSRLLREVLRSASGTRRLRRGVGPGRGCAEIGLEGGRPRPRPQSRRGRVLRPQAGVRACAMRSAATGSAARCRSTSWCRSGWARPTSREDGARKTPVMLHRAIFGSFERMIGVMIEHYAGRFPLWLAPTQAVVATIVNDADSYANEVADALRAAGMRVETDLRNEKINYKVREHSMAHVPLILAVGRRDMDGRTVAVRRLGSDKQEVLELAAAATKLSEEARPPF